MAKRKQLEGLVKVFVSSSKELAINTNSETVICEGKLYLHTAGLLCSYCLTLSFLQKI